MKHLYSIILISVFLLSTGLLWTYVVNDFFIKPYMYAAVALLIFLIGVLIFIAKILFHRGVKFQYLSSFWSFIFNDLPVQGGKTYDPIAHLLIIYEDNSVAFDFICNIDEVYKESEGLKIKLFKISRDQDEHVAQKILKFELESTQAIVICRSKLVEENPWVYGIVESWASDASEYPILVVDFLTDQEEVQLKINDELSEIPFKYDFTKLTKPSELPWRFLSRSNERGRLWKEQASSNRQIALWSIFACCLLIGCVFLVNIINQSNRIEFAEAVARSSSDGLEQILKSDSIPHFDMQKYLCEYSDIMLFKLLEENYIHYTEDKYEVSLWNASLIDSLEICYQLGWSNRRRENDAYDLFELNKNSIISCAYENPNKVIYWNKYDEGATTVYPVEKIDEGEGILRKVSGQMIIELDSGATCNYYKQESSLHNAVVCYHYYDRLSRPESERTAVCISSKTNNNEFLRNESVATFLIETAERIASINKELIVPPDLKSRYEEKDD